MIEGKWEGGARANVMRCSVICHEMSMLSVEAAWDSLSFCPSPLLTCSLCKIKNNSNKKKVLGGFGFYPNSHRKAVEDFKLECGMMRFVVFVFILVAS